MSKFLPVIELKADQCVKCGLCLPHCPTYRLFQDENESPRGRIALIQALARQQLQVDDKLQQHLAHCLGCRNCERVCPSGVEYGYMLDHSRQILQQQSPLRGIKKYLTQTGLQLTASKSAQRLLQGIFYYYQKSGLQGVLRASGILTLLRLKQLDKLITKVNRYQPFAATYPAAGQTKARLGLFTGCTGNLFDQVTLDKTIRLLQKLGYELVVPVRQTCCGALHQHQGHIDSARALALQNIQSFSGLDTIIYIASGCGAQLHDYGSLPWPDQTSQALAESFADRVKEVTAFLCDEDLTALQVKPLAKRVAIHTPCSMRNGLQQADASKTLLAHIPQLRIESIPAETGCCGAAGSYMISQAKLARTIRQATLEAINELNVDLVSTTNIGCGLHLSAGLADKTYYTHPVSLLVEQIEF